MTAVNKVVFLCLTKIDCCFTVCIFGSIQIWNNLLSRAVDAESLTHFQKVVRLLPTA